MRFLPEKYKYNRTVVPSFFFICLLLVKNIFTIRNIFITGADGAVFGDFHSRWQECACALLGINPLEAIAQQVAVSEGIGIIPAGAGTVPWAFLLGNVFNPGFLPYKVALPYVLCLYVALPILTGAILFRHLRPICGNTYALLCAALPATCSCWANSAISANQGALMCCVIIIAMCVCDDHPYLAGVLLAIAMVKPQTCTIFFFYLLFSKRLKTVFTSVFIVIASWAVVAWHTHTAPLSMLLDMLHTGLGYTSSPWGLFDILKFYHFSTPQILACNFAVAFAYLGVCWYLICKHKLQQNRFLLFAVSAIVSSFWFYKQLPDLVVLAIPAMVVLYAARPTVWRGLFAAWCIVLFCTGIVQVSAATAISFLLGGHYEFIYEIVLFAEKLFYMAVGVWMIFDFHRLPNLQAQCCEKLCFSQTAVV